MKRKLAIGVTAVLIAAGAAAWWYFDRRASAPHNAEPEVGSLLPDRTPPVSTEARPLILTPSLALQQDNQEHTVEFRVRALGEHLDDKGRTTGIILMDGPGALRGTAEVDLATIHVFVPAALVEQFRSQTGKDLGRYLRDKPVRVRGKIQRQRVAFESSDGHLVDHARVRIDLTGLDRIGVVPPTTQPGSERAAADRQEQERKSRVAVSAEALLRKRAPALDPKQWLNDTGPTSWEKAAGRVVLLDFWGRWCGPCVRNLPRVEELHAKYSGRGLLIVGVHTPEGSDNLAAFLSERKVAFPVMLDTGKTAERYGIESWPTYFLIDKTGKLVWGFSNTPPTDTQIERLLE